MLSKRNKTIFILLLAFVSIAILFISFGRHQTDNGLKIENRTSKSGHHYSIFYKGALVIDFAVTRPEPSNKQILLCIPAAFTDVQTLKIDGLYIDHGVVHHQHQINHSLGGGIKITNGECEIFPTNRGLLLNDSMIQILAASKASCFQQIQMIEKGIGATYKDIKLFQRRALVKFKNKQTAIVESYEHISLSAFTEDLLELGATDALYTDMGSYDEGWYKDPGNNKIVPIGRIKKETAKQSNWVIFKSK